MSLNGLAIEESPTLLAGIQLLRAQRENREENGLSTYVGYALFLLPLNARNPVSSIFGPQDSPNSPFRHLDFS